MWRNHERSVSCRLECDQENQPVDCGRAFRPVPQGVQEPGLSAALCGQPNVRFHPALRNTVRVLPIRARWASHPDKRHGCLSAPAAGPGVIPLRLSESPAPEIERSAPSFCLRRTSRKCPTASGRANCSPEKPDTNLPPPNLAARLQAAVDVEQIAPGRQPVGFAFQKTPKHDAVTTQKRACNVLDSIGIALPAWRGQFLLEEKLVAHLRRCRLAKAQRPAASMPKDDARRRRLPRNRLSLIRRHQKRPKASEAVGG